MAPTKGDKKAKHGRRTAVEVDPALAAEEAETEVEERLSSMRRDLAQQEILVQQMREGQAARQQLTADVREMMHALKRAEAAAHQEADKNAAAVVSAIANKDADDKNNNDVVEKDYESDFEPEGADDDDAAAEDPDEEAAEKQAEILLDSVLGGMLKHLAEVQDALADLEKHAADLEEKQQQQAVCSDDNKIQHVDPAPSSSTAEQDAEADKILLGQQHESDSMPVRHCGFGVVGVTVRKQKVDAEQAAVASASAATPVGSHCVNHDDVVEEEEGCPVVCADDDAPEN